MARIMPVCPKNSGPSIMHENVLFLDLKLKVMMGFGHILEFGKSD